MDHFTCIKFYGIKTMGYKRASGELSEWRALENKHYHCLRKSQVDS